MSLFLGLVVGLAYGLSLFGGAFLAMPVLVIGAGFSVRGSVPVALVSLALCAAVAAGDGVRSRQCDAPLALAGLAGAVPATVALVVLGQWLPVSWFCGLFALAAIGTALRLFFRQAGDGGLLPAALLRAPRRALVTDAIDRRYSWRTSLLSAVGGASVAPAVALGVIPGARALWSPGHLLFAQPFVRAATDLFVIAIAALTGALAAYVAAPGVDGYTTGLYVLGAVAGMGFARRVVPRVDHRLSGRLIAALVVLAGLALPICVFWRTLSVA